MQIASGVGGAGGGGGGGCVVPEEEQWGCTVCLCLGLDGCVGICGPPRGSCVTVTPQFCGAQQSFKHLSRVISLYLTRLFF